MSPLAVIVCALAVLGRTESSFPPIRLVATAPPGTSAGLEAFVVRDSGTIYVLTSSAAFEAARRATCRGSQAIRKIASILIHEEAHLSHNADEREAYHAQLGTLMRLGTGPDTELYQGVQRAMQAVVRAQGRQAPIGTTPFANMRNRYEAVELRTVTGKKDP